MRNELIGAFDAFNKMNIVVVGDVMMDAYIWGDVTRISPEAPVPVISKTRYETRLGGAGNVALNLLSMGANPILCSVIGDDSQAQSLENLFRDSHLSTEGLVKQKERITTVKTRVISQNHHLLRIDEEDSSPISSDLEKMLVQRVESIVNSTQSIDAIIFEDYDKGVITPQVIASVVQIAKKKNIPTLVDPKKRNFLDFKGVTFFKPNLKEFREGYEVVLPKGDRQAIIDSARKYLKETSNEGIMITMAEQGVFICSNTDYHFYPAQIRNIADVSGAGDTVISISALCLAAGMPLSMVAQIANMGGGMVCEKSGVVPINKDELLYECLLKIPEFQLTKV